MDSQDKSQLGGGHTIASDDSFVAMETSVSESHEVSAATTIDNRQNVPATTTAMTTTTMMMGPTLQGGVSQSVDETIAAGEDQNKQDLSAPQASTATASQSTPSEHNRRNRHLCNKNCCPRHHHHHGHHHHHHHGANHGTLEGAKLQSSQEKIAGTQITHKSTGKSSTTKTTSSRLEGHAPNCRHQRMTIEGELSTAPTSADHEHDNELVDQEQQRQPPTTQAAPTSANNSTNTASNNNLCQNPHHHHHHHHHHHNPGSHSHNHRHHHHNQHRQQKSSSRHANCANASSKESPQMVSQSASSLESKTAPLAQGCKNDGDSGNRASISLTDGQTPRPNTDSNSSGYAQQIISSGSSATLGSAMTVISAASATNTATAMDIQNPSSSARSSSELQDAGDVITMQTGTDSVPTKRGSIEQVHRQHSSCCQHHHHHHHHRGQHHHRYHGHNHVHQTAGGQTVSETPGETLPGVTAQAQATGATRPTSGGGASAGVDGNGTGRHTHHRRHGHNHHSHHKHKHRSKHRSSAQVLNSSGSSSNQHAINSRTSAPNDEPTGKLENNVLHNSGPKDQHGQCHESVPMSVNDSVGASATDAGQSDREDSARENHHSARDHANADGCTNAANHACKSSDDKILKVKMSNGFRMSMDGSIAVVGDDQHSMVEPMVIKSTACIANNMPEETRDIVHTDSTNKQLADIVMKDHNDCAPMEGVTLDGGASSACNALGDPSLVRSTGSRDKLVDNTSSIKMQIDSTGLGDTIEVLESAPVRIGTDTMADQRRSLLEPENNKLDLKNSARNSTYGDAMISNSVKPPAGNDRRCCLCWCCCCSCSCLSVKNFCDKQPKDAIDTIQTAAVQTENPGDSIPEVPASLDEIRSWSDSFDRLMRCYDGRQVFRDFLRCEYSEENILFWLACEELKKETDAKSVDQKARTIYEDYISILSPKEVSLDSRVREVINKNMEHPTPNAFDEAQLQIYTLMHRDSYPRFINSALYRKLAQLPTPSRKSSS